jgi:hypothetical protein
MISVLTGGRPRVGRPESLAQCARKRRRCQLSTVSGHDDEGLPPACPRPGHPDQNNRSLLRSFGRDPVRLYTASCWRKARFSRARER